MCFLKTLKPLDQIQSEKNTFADQSASQSNFQYLQPTITINKLFPFNLPIILSQQDMLLQNLMRLVDSNNLYLQNIEDKLNRNDQILTQSHKAFNYISQPERKSLTVSERISLQIDEDIGDSPISGTNTLICQLFGEKKYKYKLQLQSEFPTTIYKERNFNISLNLIDNKSNKVLNSNIIHLCLGVCDASGNWVTSNKAGENFMKGKTEIEMYHGEGSFLKIYPRDVSRNYTTGKIHFIVYSQPSMLKFSNNSSNLQEMVNSSEIEPLLISEVLIKAKKN